MTTGALVLALQLLVLHRSDGGEVTVNPEQITSLRSPSAQFRQMVPAGHCIIDLADRKFIAVLETCEQVRRQLER